MLHTLELSLQNSMVLNDWLQTHALCHTIWPYASGFLCLLSAFLSLFRAPECLQCEAPVLHRAPLPLLPGPVLDPLLSRCQSGGVIFQAIYLAFSLSIITSLSSLVSLCAFQKEQKPPYDYYFHEIQSSTVAGTVFFHVFITHTPEWLTQISSSRDGCWIELNWIFPPFLPAWKPSISPGHHDHFSGL